MTLCAAPQSGIASVKVGYQGNHWIDDREMHTNTQNLQYTFVRMNTFFTNPPLIITEEELRHGFDIIDRGLSAIA